MTSEKNDSATCSTSSEVTEKKKKRGIIYISSIPPYMNVTRIREYFGDFGEVGRVFLQLQLNDKKKKKKVANKFTEGWVEFEKKSVAKRVVQMLNNTQVSTRKSSIHFDYLWNMKYLSGFKWTHLNERLAYEKAAKRHKLRAETELAKKNAAFFNSNLNKKNKEGAVINKDFDNLNADKLTANKSDEKSSKVEDRSEFLGSLFG